MPVNDAADVGQADTGALEIRGPVQTLKNSKELMRVAHIEPHSVIANKNDILERSPAGPKLYSSHFPCACVFEGIRNEVEQHLSKE
jgi:hypothetical protein